MYKYTGRPPTRWTSNWGRSGGQLHEARLITAGGQRGYYSGSISSCTQAGAIAVTILAGPLNYMGVNLKVTCTVTVPQPSK